MPTLHLGRVVDPATQKPASDRAQLDTRKLVRHGVILGMTGSGKTGLATVLLEEIALAGVPIVCIDPKGDLTNLALAFPELLPKDFEAWVDPADARRKGMEVAERAADLARSWQDAHTADGLDPKRRAFAQSRVTIYTPGSSAGVPVNVLAALRAPDLDGDPEGLAELAASTVRSLLGLVGVDADPTRDAEAVVLTQVLQAAWGTGQDLTVESLLTRLVDPPFSKVGVFPLEGFFPRKARTTLAMKLNAVIASPAFAAWSTGQPLDLDALLAPPATGAAPIHVFTTAHLDDDQRRFFTSTLLSAMVAWSRRQPGTGDLRALLYMDEVFGYLPPYPQNPPSKGPILTLMKQARAVGVGVVLATQNPVDLDYKALSNAGTWLIGRLQTDQDRERVLDGLAGAGGGFDRATVAGWLQKIPGRTFVHRDADEDQPRLLTSRWALSYLRGPLTRQEIARLPKPQIKTEDQPPEVVEGLTADPPPAPEGIEVRWLSAAAARESLSAVLGDIDVPRSPDGKPVWAPGLWVRARLRFDEGSEFVEDREEQRLYLPLKSRLGDGAEPAFTDEDFVEAPDAGWYLPLPDDVDEAREFTKVKAAILDALHRGETTVLRRHKALKIDSLPGESESAFLARCTKATQGGATAKLAKFKATVDERAKKIADKLERKNLELQQATAQSRAQMAQEALNVGEMVFGFFFGKPKSVSGAIGKRRQTMSANAKVQKIQEEIAQAEEELLDLQQEVAAQVAQVSATAVDPAEVEVKTVTLEKNDVDIVEMALVWVAAG
jgi:hypothetical protein